MNVYTWTIGASHTPAAFLALAGTALPFDITDTIATLLFALAFGPELARLLARTRERMNMSLGTPPAQSAAPTVSAGGAATAGRGVTIASAILALIVASLGVGGQVVRASTASAHAASLSPELSYLTSAQNSDGGFGGAPGQGSSELYTRLGGDGARGRRARPGERESRWTLGARLAARRSLDPERSGRRRAHDPRRARVRSLRVLVRGTRPRRRSAARA